MNFKSFLLIESKQEIVNLGFPEIIAKLFQERFGKLSFLISKWFKEYKYSSNDVPNNWWLLTTSNFRENPSLYDLTYLYASTFDVDSYKTALNKLELEPNDFIDDYYLKEQRIALENQIKNKLFADGFFKYNELIADILSGKIKDVASYKNLSFSVAQDKYDKLNIFKNKEPIRSYENGYKWIDVGQRCQLVGKLMKNCGSAGLMSWDNDRTILTLFDSRNKSHVMVTYSPNEKRVSGDVGIGSTEVKNKYHFYVLDLSKFLGAKFDTEKTKSTFLKIKYLLSGITNEIEELPFSGMYDKFYKFSIKNEEYYTNSNVVVSKTDVENVLFKSGQIELKNDQKNIIKNIFNYLNQPILANVYVRYIPINQFVKNQSTGL